MRALYEKLLAKTFSPQFGPGEIEQLAAFLDGVDVLTRELKPQDSSYSRILLLHPREAGYQDEYPAFVCDDYGNHADSCPCHACAALRRRLAHNMLGGHAVATTDVASFFRRRQAGEIEEEEYRGYGPTCAPVASDSFAWVPMDGDLPTSVGQSPDKSWGANYYDWFDLADVPVGGAVWRISVTRTLWHFGKVAADEWRVTCIPQVAWPSHFNRVLEGAEIAQRFLNAVFRDELQKEKTSAVHDVAVAEHSAETLHAVRPAEELLDADPVGV